ncbi:MAG: GDP-mannose 4,6-dehydratase [Candidatus Peregrinibacteria bacterium GW2011_GWC2_39_14]|nr:MAG: GDP-mannose 4,6-dehydratase [Candidatus Peregrinibacteria bacterium GW2011_GWC2_39_14]
MGLAGQDGSYLANFLLQKGYRVVGLCHSSDPKALWRLDYFNIRSKVKLEIGDITDAAHMEKIINAYKPDELYNLAGISSVARSWDRPVETFRVNALAVIGILDVLRRRSPQTHFFQASSAEIYGNVREVVNEKISMFNPLHPYGTSKLAAHFAIKNFRDQYGLFAVNGILFNHESPLREDYFVTKVIAQGVARLVRGEVKKFRLGNINVSRDFGFVGDFVEAMWSTLNHTRAEDFVICTGKSFTVRDFIREAFACIDIADWQKYIEIDSLLVRKQEVKKMRGTSAKIKKELDWRPTISFKTLVKMMVEHEINTLQHGGI